MRGRRFLRTDLATHDTRMGVKLLMHGNWDSSLSNKALGMTKSKPRTRDESHTAILPWIVGPAMIAAAYCGCYFLMVKSQGFSSLSTPSTIEFAPTYCVPFHQEQPLPEGSDSWARKIFSPIHWVDRRLRRSVWQTRLDPWADLDDTL